MRISAIGPLLFSELVPSALAEFQSAHPELRLEVSWVDRLDIEDWVVNQNVDLGLTLMPVDHPLLDAHEFVSVNAVALLPAGHALAAKPEVGPSDFRGERLIIPARKTRLRQLADKCMLEAKHPLADRGRDLDCHRELPPGRGRARRRDFRPLQRDRAFTGDRIVVRPWKPSIRMSYAATWLKSRSLSDRSVQLIGILRRIGDRMANA